VFWQNCYMSLVPRGWDADGQVLGPGADNPTGPTLHSDTSTGEVSAAQFELIRLPEFDLVDAQLLEGGPLLLQDNSGIPAPATVVSVDRTQGTVSCWDSLCSLFAAALSPVAQYSHICPRGNAMCLCCRFCCGGRGARRTATRSSKQCSFRTATCRWCRGDGTRSGR
jgi:hypothetical protein